MLQQRQKPTQGSPTELQFLSFTFPFFPNSPAPPLNCAFSIFYVCSCFFYSYILSLLAFSFFSISPIFSSIFFVYVFFLFLPGLLASHCMCRVVAWRHCGASRPCRNTDCLPLAPRSCLSLSLSFHSPTLCGLYQFSACRHSSH